MVRDIFGQLIDIQPGQETSASPRSRRSPLDRKPN